jgi:hypothetical protein
VTHNEGQHPTRAGARARARAQARARARARARLGLGLASRLPFRAASLEVKGTAALALYMSLQG